MDNNNRVQQHIAHSLENLMGVAHHLAEPVSMMGERCAQCLLSDHKIIAIADSQAQNLAQYFISSLLNRYEVERPSLPAISLDFAQSFNAIAQDSGLEQAYEKPLRTLGQAGDLLVVISQTEYAASIQTAIATAHQQGLGVLIIGPEHFNNPIQTPQADCIQLPLPIQNNSDLQLTQLLVLQCLCDFIDHRLFAT